MHPILVHFGSYSLRSYVFCIAAAGAVSILLFRLLNRRLAAEKPDDFWILANVMAVSGFLGARLFFLLAYRHGPAGKLSISGLILSNSEGLSTYGAIFGVVAGTALYCALRNLNIRAIMDNAAVTMPIAHGIARTGCLLTGCCFGRPVGRSVFWALRFTDPQSGIPPFLLNVPLYPTQLLEIAGDAIIAALLLAARRTPDARPGTKGTLMAWYAIGYGLMRFLIDPYRADSRRLSFLGLSLDQIFGAALIVTAFSLLSIVRRLRFRSAPTSI